MIYYFYNALYKKDLYYIYLYYLRYRIKNVKTCHDLIYILKNINFYFRNICSDNLNNIIIDCLKKYPLYTYEIQKFSVLQQQYDMNLGIENYATFIFWICVISSINENQKLLH
jgi:hypothetical protein